MPGKARLARSIVRVEAIPLHWQPRHWQPSLQAFHPRAWLGGLAPTRRSLALGLGVLALALGGYLIARESSLFAIDRIEVHGGSPRVARQVHGALASLVGKPLVGLDGSAMLRTVDALPSVASATYDRDFPHTLRISVVAERPAAVLRRGADTWLVSTRGRVMERLSATALPNLPRIWLSTRMPVRTGADLTAGGAATSAHAAGLTGAFGARVASVSYTSGSLVLHLRSGLELLLGDAGDIRLKVAVASRLLAMLPAGSTYLDVSIPGRPVSGYGSPRSDAAPSSSRG
ncbi:MAG TPA: FtsQ-type POTRA domain-containing protein [Gaiellaceae bacterium]|nr:FtsQ-type POTRA domain-containing protein [Gaiellaceae bacterium]